MAREDAIRAAFGLSVRHFRHELALSQEALAEKAGFHRTYVGGIERGEQRPSFETAIRLIEALEITLSEFAPYFERRLEQQGAKPA
jgi:transcriptional regulator with XRE-family HTH domain